MITAITLRIYCGCDSDYITPKKLHILFPFLVSIYAAMFTDVLIATILWRVVQ